jgi:hypothetical protein
MIDCISRKGRNIDEVTAVLDDAMGIIKDRMPDLYHETIHQLAAIAYAITPEEARDKVRSMRPYGQKWDYDTVKAFLAAKGINNDVCKYYLCMNMAYNDYYKTAESVGKGEDPEFYFSIARDFINDADAKDFKVEKYFLA